jgi:hypothetical protein
MKDFSHLLRGLTVILVVLAFSKLALTGVFAVAGESEAETEIQKAEAALSSAYVAVLEAEKNGADVSGLLAELGSGGEFLAEARMRYRNDDFDGASYYAGLSVENVDGLIGEAEQLKALAIAENKERFFLTVTGSGVAVIVVVLGSIGAWLFFKRRYFEKVLGMKPEVAEG